MESAITGINLESPMAKTKQRRVAVSDLATLFVCAVCLAIALMAFVAVLMP
jgi:hypothetical protein